MYTYNEEIFVTSAEAKDLKTEGQPKIFPAEITQSFLKILRIQQDVARFPSSMFSLRG